MAPRLTVMVSEAHLPVQRRSVPLVRWVPRKRRSWTGWAIFVGFIVLNETRGLYMVAEFLKAAGYL
jgi:hypothetical protein